MIENFAMPDQDYGVRATTLKSKQLKTLRSEQKRFLRGVFSVSDDIRYVVALQSSSTRFNSISFYQMFQVHSSSIQFN